MEDILIPMTAIICIFVIMPAIFLHYGAQWRKNRSLSVEDENLMDELHMLARRLSERMDTVERLVSAESPDFRPHRSLGQDRGYAALAEEEREDRLLGDPQPARTRFDRR